MLNARNPHVDKSRAGTTVTIEKVARESEVLIESLKSLYTATSSIAIIVAMLIQMNFCSVYM
jgi:hypothetical protein